jgi:hypothetical protein
VATPAPAAQLGAGAVAVAEPEATPASAAPVAPAARDTQMVADDVALLLGRESALDGDTTAGAWVEDGTAATAGDEGLADTFQALLEVEQGIRAPLAPAALGDDDVDRIALRVAAVVATDVTLASRLEAAIVERVAAGVSAAAERAVERLAPELVAAVVDRVVRQLAPPLVESMAHGAVREEIARMRGVARGV